MAPTALSRRPMRWLITCRPSSRCAGPCRISEGSTQTGPRALRKGSALRESSADGSERAAVLTLVVRAVLAGADRLPPPAVVAVPRDRALEALGEAHLRLPAERARLVGRQRVAAGVGPAGGGKPQPPLVGAGGVGAPAPAPP